jgi:hypothetical protein
MGSIAIPKDFYNGKIDRLLEAIWTYSLLLYIFLELTPLEVLADVLSRAALGGTFPYLTRTGMLRHGGDYTGTAALNLQASTLRP